MRSTKFLYRACVLLAAALAAALLGAVVLRAVGASATATYWTILSGPLADKYGITEVLVRAVPLTLIGLGIAIAFRSDILN
ncbi:MAG TPA: hypothetical protein VN436_04245, partial [Holophaga sp.]|nr:hypothetical protein [Holophaga sp.]